MRLWSIHGKARDPEVSPYVNVHGESSNPNQDHLSCDWHRSAHELAKGRAKAAPPHHLAGSKTIHGRHQRALGGGVSLLKPLGVVLVSPSLPQRPRRNSRWLGPPFPPFFFSDLKPLLTSLHFSSLFLLRLGSFLGSILDPFRRASWHKFGPNRLLTPYFFKQTVFQESLKNLR